MHWEVLDKLTGELMSFGNQYMAEQEAQCRLNLHRNGYNIRRNHIKGCDAIMKIERNRYIICLNTTEETD